jgi:hypothetical protein
VRTTSPRSSVGVRVLSAQAGDDVPSNDNATPKLKIMDEMLNIESECVIMPFDEYGSNDDKSQLKKRVHWGENLYNNYKNDYNNDNIEYAVLEQ